MLSLGCDTYIQSQRDYIGNTNTKRNGMHSTCLVQSYDAEVLTLNAEAIYGEEDLALWTQIL